MQDFDFEYERYKDFDFSDAKPITNPKILEARARKKAHDERLAMLTPKLLAMIDDDVLALMSEKAENPAEIAKMNSVLRALLA